MSCTQAISFLPSVKFGPAYRPSSSSRVYASHLNMSPIRIAGNHNPFPRLLCDQPKHRRFHPVCFATGDSNRKNRGFVWEKHIQDLRKEQLHNQEIGGDGGNGGGREGRDGGGRSDSNGGQEDQNSLDETIQVVLATLSFILAYTYLLNGAQLTFLAKDYIRYRSGGRPSRRLLKIADDWQEFHATMTGFVESQKVWLGRAVVAVTILLQNPRKLVELMRHGEC